MFRQPPRFTLFPYPTLFRSAGELDLPVATNAGLGGQVGQTLRPLAQTGARRSPSFPDLPTVAESGIDRKSTRLNSSHANISYAVFCLKKKKQHQPISCKTLH